MEDFNLVVKELISKGIENVIIPETIKSNFDQTAENYIKNGNLLDAIKVFALTKNNKKLIETADLCLKENKPYEAFYGFYYANESEGLNKVGFIFLQIPDIEKALKSFKLAKNNEMIKFLEENF